MEKFIGYAIAVPIIQALVLGLVWTLKGPKAAKLTGIFFLGFLFGALSMFIKAMLVFKP